MKKVGIAARLLAVMAVLSLAAFAVAGCGSEKNDTSSSDSGATSGSAGVEANGTVNKSETVQTDLNGDLTDDQKAVVAAIGGFADATDKHDYKTLCADYLTKESQKIGARTGDASSSCAEFFEKQGAAIKSFKITVTKADVAKDGKTATIEGTTVVNGAKQPSQPIALKKVNGEWRIALLGN
jgi:hypothetical protein